MKDIGGIELPETLAKIQGDGDTESSTPAKATVVPKSAPVAPVAPKAAPVKSKPAKSESDSEE